MAYLWENPLKIFGILESMSKFRFVGEVFLMENIM